MIKLHHLLSITLLLSPVITTCSDYGVLTEYNNNRVTKVEDFAVFSQQELGKISLYHNDNDKSFIVEKENRLQEVKSYFVDKTLVKMTTEQLKAFQQVGRIHVKELSDGELKLVAKTLGDGGGPIGWWLGYTLGKSVAMSAPLIAIKLGLRAAGADEKVVEKIPDFVLGLASPKQLEAASTFMTGTALNYADVKGMNQMTNHAHHLGINQTVTDISTSAVGPAAGYFAEKVVNSDVVTEYVSPEGNQEKQKVAAMSATFLSGLIGYTGAAEAFAQFMGGLGAMLPF